MLLEVTCVARSVDRSGCVNANHEGDIRHVTGDLSPIYCVLVYVAFNLLFDNISIATIHAITYLRENRKVNFT